MEEKRNVEVVNAAPRNQHHIVFLIISIIGSVLIFFGLNGGWEILLFTPVLFVFMCVYSGIFSHLLKKKESDAFTAYALLAFVLISVFAFKINFPVMTDSEATSYFFPSIVGGSDRFFDFYTDNQFFPQVLDITFWYFIFASVLVFIKINASGSLKKYQGTILILVSAFISLFTIGYILQTLPQARVLEGDYLEERKSDLKADRDNTFARDYDKIRQTTFVDRTYSFFTPQEPNSVSDCGYSQTFAESALSNVNYQISCRKDFGLYNTPYLPYSTTTAFGINYPIPSGEWKKGDVLAVVVKMDPSTYFRVNVNGNNAKKKPYRMPPFAYDGIKEFEKIDGKNYYETSLVQFQVMVEPRTVMILYPINSDADFKNFYLDLTPFSTVENPNEFGVARTELVEVARIRPPFTQPEWLTEWEKESNPFLPK